MKDRKATAALGIVLALVLVAAVGVVQAEEMRPRGVDAVMSDSRAQQGLAAIGSPAKHDRMDLRLGGDGSATWAACRTDLAIRYLEGAPIGMMGGAGRGMMGRTDIGSVDGFRNGIQGGRNVGPMMGFGFIGMLLGGLLLALLVVGLVLAFRGSMRGPSQETQVSREEYAKARVMALLAERYARGEIDDEEYRKKKCELR